MVGLAGVIVFPVVAVCLVIASFEPLVVGALGLSPALWLTCPLAEAEFMKSSNYSELLPPVVNPPPTSFSNALKSIAGCFCKGPLPGSLRVSFTGNLVVVVFLSFAGFTEATGGTFLG